MITAAGRWSLMGRMTGAFTLLPVGDLLAPYEGAVPGGGARVLGIVAPFRT